MSERLHLGTTSIPNIDASRGLIFDTNVWLLIYAPAAGPPDKRSVAYSAFYKLALERQCPIFICQTIITEYIAVSLRIHAKLAGWMPSMGAGKIHSQPNYSVWAADVANEVSYIIEGCKCLPDEFDGANVDAHLSLSGSERLDYCDVLILQTCKDNGLRLVTDDADFGSQTVDIISANKRIALPN